MMGVLKMAGVSAVLAAGLVTAFDAPQATTATTTKIYSDRVAPEAASSIVLAEANRVTMTDAAPVAQPCRGQTWPYLSGECTGPNEGRKVVRTITIERRDAPNTSTLVRLPAETAGR